MTKPIITRMRWEEGTKFAPIVLTAATLTLNLPKYLMHWLNLQRAAGQTITLPPATGKGGLLRIFVGTSITSNTTAIRTGNSGADTIAGVAAVQNAVFQTSSNHNTITMNGGTTGGLLGTVIYLQDMAKGQWMVEANILGSGTAANPFSNT